MAICAGDYPGAQKGTVVTAQIDMEIQGEGGQPGSVSAVGPLYALTGEMTVGTGGTLGQILVWVGGRDDKLIINNVMTNK